MAINQLEATSEDIALLDKVDHVAFLDKVGHVLCFTNPREAVGEWLDLIREAWPKAVVVRSTTKRILRGRTLDTLLDVAATPTGEGLSWGMDFEVYPDPFAAARDDLLEAIQIALSDTVATLVYARDLTASDEPLADAISMCGLI